MKSNLWELKRFLENNIDCLCFYNREEDGYKAKLEDESLIINTLSVFFINGLDYKIPSLAKLYDENGIDRTKVPYMSGFFGNMIFMELIKDGKIIEILDNSHFAVAGGLGHVLQYYEGRELFDSKFGIPGEHKEKKYPRSSFYIKHGDGYKEYIETWLSENGYPLISKENGYYINEEWKLYKGKSLDEVFRISEEMEKKKKSIFVQERKFFSSLRRQTEYGNMIMSMTREEMEEYKEIIGGNDIKVVKNDQFDD